MMGTDHVMMLMVVLAAAKAGEAQSCGGTFSGSVGDVTSPGYPSNYGANLKCEYVFPAVPGQVLQVVFESFKLQEKSGWWLFKKCRDYVEVYDGNNQIGKYCGDEDPGVITTSSEVRIVFTSDSNTAAPGFYASFIRMACGGIFSGEAGKATSPDFPEPYANNLNCEYVFPADGRPLTITFKAFKLEGRSGWLSGRKCRDSITVYDGYNKLGEFCGDESPGKITTFSELRIVFTTNKDKADSGFFAEFTRTGDVVDVTTLPPPPPPPNTAGPALRKCGISPIQPLLNPDQNRIVNGQEAIPHSWPWQISLQTDDGYHSCGGSLVDENWVVTAAHCKPDPRTHRVVLGEHDRGSNAEDIQRLRIEKSICHPMFDSSTTDYDICLVKLATPAQIGAKVSPVCLPDATDAGSFGPGTDCYASGWGKTSVFGGTVMKLQQTRTKVLSTAACMDTWGGRITDRMICAGGDGSTVCQGDSGGPLVCPRAGAWQLVGVVSWGNAFCSTRSPGVFARVTELREWLDQNMAGNN